MSQRKKQTPKYIEVVEKGIEEPQKFYTARGDRTFKATLGNEEHQSMLEQFLSRILKKNVKILKYMRNEQTVDSVTEKVKIVDLLVLLEDNRVVHLELNNINLGMLEEIQKRNFIYVASDYVHIVGRGEDYSVKTPFIAIDLTYGLGNSAELVEVFSYQNEKGKKYIDDLETMVVNMDKAMEYWYNKDEEKICKNKHLIMLDCGPEDLKVLSKGDELVREFADNIIRLNTNKKFRQLMTVEEDAAKLEKTMMNKAKKEGLEEGRASGLEEGHASGLKEGATKTRKDIITKMYNSGISVSDIANILEISEKDIKQILLINE